MRALQIEVVTDENDIDIFTHLVGTKYFDNKTRHEYINTHITLCDKLIVALRASNGGAGNKGGSPIHITVITMMGESGTRIRRP